MEGRVHILVEKILAFILIHCRQGKLAAVFRGVLVLFSSNSNCSPNDCVEVPKKKLYENRIEVLIKIIHHIKGIEENGTTRFGYVLGVTSFRSHFSVKPMS